MQCISLLQTFKIIELLTLLLRQFEKSEPQIVYEILWILINIEANDYEDTSYLNPLISNEVLSCFENLITNDYCDIVDNALWVLLSLTSKNNLQREALLSHPLYEKMLSLSNADNIELNFVIGCLEFFTFCVGDVDYAKFEKQILKTLERLSLEIYSQYKKISYWAFRGIANISDLNCESSKLMKEILNSGIIVKILKTNFDKKENILFFSLKILVNVTSESDDIIEKLIQMRLIDFYEIMLEKYKNNKDILLILLSGFVNLTGGKNLFKKLVINSVLFQEKIFLKFLYADSQEIKLEMINVIKNLSYSKDKEILLFLNDTAIINEIINLLSLERSNVELSSQYMKIIANFLLHYHNLQIEKKQNFYYIAEKFKDLLTNANTFVSSEEMEKYLNVINIINN